MTKFEERDLSEAKQLTDAGPLRPDLPRSAEGAMNCCSFSHSAPYDLRRIRQYRTPAVTSTHIRDRGRGGGTHGHEELALSVVPPGQWVNPGPAGAFPPAPYFLPFDCFPGARDTV
jgi:hypothetical protein